MGHAAYARGSAAISAQIDQEAKGRRKPREAELAAAKSEREKARADKAERQCAELETTLRSARRSVKILRLTLDQERASRREETEALKYKIGFLMKRNSRLQNREKA